jgi:hypothetical protein
MKEDGVPGDVKFYTSGDAEGLKSLLPVLLGEDGEVQEVKWIEDQLIVTVT